MIEISKEESVAYTINYFRANVIDNTNANDFYLNLWKKNVDVCKVKTLVKNINFINDLSSFCLHTNLNNLNYFNELDIINHRQIELSNNYTYRKAQNKDIFFINECVIDFSINNSWNQSISSFAFYHSKEKEIATALKWTESFINKSNKTINLLLFKNEPVGFFSGSISNNSFYGGLYGIHSKHRGAGHSKAIYNSTIKYCVENDLRYFFCEVGVNNIKSQKSALNSGLIQKDILLQNEVFCFFNIIKSKLNSSTFQYNKANLIDVDIDNFSINFNKTVYIPIDNSIDVDKGQMKKITINETENQKILVFVHQEDTRYVLKYILLNKNI
jgi:hypothetical protein